MKTVSFYLTAKLVSSIGEELEIYSVDSLFRIVAAAVVT